MPATISASEAAASAQNTTMVANGRPIRCTTKPPNGIDIMPTHRAILSARRHSAMVIAAACRKKRGNEAEIGDQAGVERTPHDAGGDHRCEHAPAAAGRMPCGSRASSVSGRAAGGSNSATSSSDTRHSTPASSITERQPNATAMRGSMNSPSAMPNGQVDRITAIASTISRRANQSVVILVITRLNSVAPMPLASRPTNATA